MMNGSLSLYIPVLSLPQRGGYNLELGYISQSSVNDPVQQMTISTTWDTQEHLHDTIHYYEGLSAFSGRWSQDWNYLPVDVNIPRLTSGIEFMGDHAYSAAGLITSVTNIFCETNFTFMDWAGNSHPFENITNCNTVNAGVDLSAHAVTESSDGSFYQLDTSDPTDFKVISKDGTLYHFHRPSGACNAGNGDCQGNNIENIVRTTDKIVDTNNNTILIQKTSGTATSQVFAITDTIGRTITVSSLGIQYKDSNGYLQSIVVANSQSSETASYKEPFSCSYTGPTLNPSPVVTPSTSAFAVSGVPKESYFTITFPSGNGGHAKKYQLEFNAEGSLDKISYPYGGYTRYDYTKPVQISDDLPPVPNVSKLQNNVTCNYFMHQVLDKYECKDASGTCSAEDQTTYTAKISTANTYVGGGVFNSSMKAVHPLGNYEIHSFNTVYSPRTNPQETDVAYYDSSDIKLRSVHNDFPPQNTSNNGIWNYDSVLPTTVTTTQSDGGVTKTSSVGYTYDSYTSIPLGSVYIDNPLSIVEKDYDGNPNRSTAQQWKHAGDFTAKVHILDRLSYSTKTDNVKNLSNTMTYAYDGTVGNVIGVTVTAGTETQSTTYLRNSDGQITQKTDPNGNITQIQYTDTNGWGNSSCAPTTDSSAYPTKIIDPLLVTTQFKYNSCTGTVSAVIGPNAGQTTSYSYDALQRVTSATLADTGAQAACYFDSSPSSVTTYTLQANGATLPTSCTTPTTLSSGSVSNSISFDGLGRKLQTRLLSDSSGTIYTDTTYDPNGRVASESNPYRSTVESSYGLVQYQYDALDRKTSRTNQDGGSQNWAYSGSTAGSVVTFTDELSNQWQRTSDAFGRITSVLEPSATSSSPTMETDYTYDGFGNLWNVSQTGGTGSSASYVTRSFTYDGLSRLLTSSNPESGQVTYSYDHNNNLKQKTSAAVNATTGTVTIGYCYDALNRPVGKWSAPPPSGCVSTPTAVTSTLLATYTYATSATSGNNAIGHLTDEKAYLNGTLISEEAPQTFDLMGRQLTEAQTPFSPIGAAFTLTSSYDRAGHQISRGNTATGITIGYVFDTAGRLNGITSNLASYGASTYPTNLYSVLKYSPAGIESAKYAGAWNGDGYFNLYRYYDSRMRVLDNEIYPTSTASFGTASVTITGAVTPGDTGIVSVKVSNVAYGVHFGVGSTASSIASQIAYDFNHFVQSPVTVVVSNNSPTGMTGAGLCVGGLASDGVTPCAVLTLTAVQLGQYGNLPLIAMETDANTTSPSFTTTASGLALSGGIGSPQGQNTAYVYSLNYDQVGNVVRAADPLVGSWTYTYDHLNRLSTASHYGYEGNGVFASGGPYDYQCWLYDGFGNRTKELDTNGGCPSNTPDPASWANVVDTHHANYNTANQIHDSDSMQAGLGYDAAGNVTQDAANNYVYDIEGRVCAVQNRLTTVATQYVYNANGGRVAKGSITTWPAHGSVCSVPNSLIGFQLQEANLLGGGGVQEVEVDYVGGGLHQAHHNVFGDGGLIATYTATAGSDPALYFNFNDWLGTKRLEVDSAGLIVNWWRSDPFGDYLSPYLSNGPDATPHHFTGKERDTESGLDYFGARYYASSMGRWMSPDWAAGADPLPYADLSDPQTLNLYSYTQNNPLARRDPDGHASYQDCNGGTQQCWQGDYNGERDCSGSAGCLFWTAGANNGAGEWQGSDPTPPPGDPAGDAFTGLTRMMLAHSWGDFNYGLRTMGGGYAKALVNGPTPAGVALAVGLPLVPLKPLHSGDLLEKNSNISDIRKMSTQEIKDSLQPGQPGSLKVKADGTVMDGNTRLRVLQERGVDTNSLPREPYVSEPMAPWEEP